jgi:hypothetical protein
VIEPASPLAPDIRAEAERLTARVAAEGRAIRLMGGLAIWLVAPSVRNPPYARSYADLDFAAASTDRRGVADFFEASGYLPEKMFNALHGATRLNFRHPTDKWTVDVLFDQLEMSHRIDLRGRLDGSRPTLDLADLLLTKLQIWEINRKDLGDIVCLLADAPLATPAMDRAAERSIDVARLTDLARADWGLCHTIERNLVRAVDQARAEPPNGGVQDPKTTSWRMRARVGERMAWYQTPEEVRHEG